MHDYKGKIDFAIITIREDENRAVLKRFPSEEIYQGKHRSYAINRVPFSDGGYYLVAIIRSIEQGEGHSQDVARDLIEDLDPQWILLVGIAGGVPASEFTLGDVVAATRLTDFSVKAALENRAPQYAASGGPMHKQVQNILALLPAMEGQLGDWNSDASLNMARPNVKLNATNFYGSDTWKAKTKESLTRHFGRSTSPRRPLVTTGTVASSDTLMKDTETLQQWQEAARQLIAVEMELGGVYIAARQLEKEYPVLAIRGISDIVGYKRHPDWTEYACQSAAAFARAFIGTMPIPSRHPNGGVISEETPNSTILLQRLYRSSQARCIESWQSAGVPLHLAKDFAANTSLDQRANLTLSEGRLILVIGEPGSGKSLLAERAYQQAVEAALQHPAAPIPVYLHIDDINGNLENAIVPVATKLGDPETRGCIVVIDGADEAGSLKAQYVLRECRIFVQTWLKSSAVITSRHLPILTRQEEVYNLPQLSEEQAYDLIGRIAERPFDRYIGAKWSQSIREAICYPMFAILVGVRLRKDSNVHLNSVSQLMADLVDESLQRMENNAQNAQEILKRLARHCQDRGGPVPVAEFTGEEREALIASRLVLERNRGLSFVHRLYMEWFGAHCLADRTPSTQELVSDNARLERWRYSIMMAAHMLNQRQVTDLIAPLAAEKPVFASEIVEAGSKEYSYWERNIDTPPPIAEEYGHHLRTAMQSWMAGLGAMSRLLARAVTRSDGTLRPLGVSVKGHSLTFSWYEGNETKPEVFELPAGMTGMNALAHGFSTLIGYSHFEEEPLQPWRWARTHLANNLQPLLTAKSLLAPEGPLRREVLWHLALDAINAGSARTDPIPLSQLEEVLAKVPHGVPIRMGMTGRSYMPALIDALRSEVKALRQREEAALPFPHLSPDIVPPYAEFSYSSWESYSDERMVELICQVYTDALEGYRQLVETYFPKFAGALPTYTLLPVKIVGFFHAPNRDQPRWSDSVPWLWRFMDVLPFGSDNTVEIIPGDFVQDAEEQAYERRKVLRPKRIEEQGMTMNAGEPPVFGPDPATRLAYSWLKDDLRHVGWQGWANGLSF